MPIYNINVTNSSPGAPTTTAVATIGSTSSLIGTAAGKGFSIFNNGSSTIFISVAATPTLTLFLAKILPGWHYEDPFLSVGAINAIIAPGTGVTTNSGGSANVTVYN